jgi:hypothetical protein
MASGKHGLPASFQGGEGAIRFFKRYEIACGINKWESDADKALHVLPLFGDSVFDFAASLLEADRNSYEKLKKAIIKQYDSAILTTSVAGHFSERKLQQGETLTELMLALNALAEKAYSELPEATRERLVRDQFIKSLPSEIHRHVLLQPALVTTEALLAEALKAAEVYSSTMKSPSVAEVVTPMDSITKMLEVLTDKVNKLEAGQATSTTVARVQQSSSRQYQGAQPSGRSFQFYGTCFACNEKGHMARDCPTKKQVVCEHCKNPGHSVGSCAIKDKQIKDF